jgi:hypothetical protein
MSERSGEVTPTRRFTRFTFANATGAEKWVDGAIRSAELVDAADTGVVVAATGAAGGEAGVAGAGKAQTVGSLP